MKWTQTPIKTLRQNPVSATIDSHILLLRAGYIYPLASGLFTYAPFMVRCLQKFESIIREELHRQGLVEIYMPMVQPKEIWESTGRWQDFSEILQKMKNRSHQEFCLGPTHEEVITDYIKNQVKSYRDLPFNLYQIQTKYRDEYRPRFGLLRCREFLMKDAYSFDLNKEEALVSFKKMEKAYHNIFLKLGAKYHVVQADSGAIGGSHSKEFHILASQGEDTLLVSEDGSYAVNKEMVQDKKIPENVQEYKGIEVGHIFYLGTKYSKAMGAFYLDHQGQNQFIEMGCYGLGLSRTLQAVVEQSHDEKGIIWPHSVAPFNVHIVSLDDQTHSPVQKLSQKIYESLWDQGVDSFLDDRREAPGVKFKDADLMGIPIRLTIGQKDLNQNQVEVTFRKDGQKQKWPVDQVEKNILKYLQTT